MYLKSKKVNQVKERIQSIQLQRVKEKIYRNLLQESSSIGLNIFGCWLTLDESQYSKDAGKLDITIRYNRPESPAPFKGRIQMNIEFLSNYIQMKHDAIVLNKLVINGDILNNGEFMNIMRSIIKSITSLYVGERTIYLRMSTKVDKVPVYLKSLGFRRVNKGMDLLLYKEEKEHNVYRFIIDTIMDSFLYRKK